MALTFFVRSRRRCRPDRARLARRMAVPLWQRYHQLGQDTRRLSPLKELLRRGNRNYTHRCHDLPPAARSLVTSSRPGEVTQHLCEPWLRQLIEVSAGATATGRLDDIDTRAGLAGIAVRATCEGRLRQGTTDPQGAFRLESIARGVPCQLEAQAGGFLPLARGFTGPVDGPAVDLGALPLLSERLVHKNTGRVGMTFGRNDEGDIVVRSAPEGSAAGKAGLKIGDVVVAVDGRQVHNADGSVVVILVGGPAGAPVLLEVRGTDGKSRQVQVIRM
jgi:hypothetical protein